MSHNRRTFLTGFGAGVLGLAGFFSPRKVLGGRRRCCSGPAVCCPPVMGGGCVGAAAGAAPAVRLQATPSIDLDYPPQGATLPGAGGFCIWGLATGVAYVSAQATWDSSSESGQPITGPTGLSVAPCNFAFAFFSVGTPGTTNVSVTVTGYDVNMNQVAQTTHDGLTIGGHLVGAPVKPGRPR